MVTGAFLKRLVLVSLEVLVGLLGMQSIEHNANVMVCVGNEVWLTFQDMTIRNKLKNGSIYINDCLSLRDFYLLKS